VNYERQIKGSFYEAPCMSDTTDSIAQTSCNSSFLLADPGKKHLVFLFSYSICRDIFDVFGIENVKLCHKNIECALSW